MNNLDPDILATTHRDEVRAQIARKGYRLNLVGFLVSEEKACVTYAEYTRASCAAVGVAFTLVRATQQDIADRISQANADPGVHGIFIYYPIFGDARDSGIKDLVAPHKDVEGLSGYWMRKLYANERFDDPQRRHKSLLPCTPLAVLKLLEQTDARAAMGLPFEGQTVCIFNRSDVVGRPLAHMLANDGARVYSFDLDGGVALAPGGAGMGAGSDGAQGAPAPATRDQALQASTVVITGVPSRQFEKVRAAELRPGTVCLNFSSVQNFEDDAKEKAAVYIPRVGPMTIAMCLRNALRLFENHHVQGNTHAAH
jgi:methylenetetrahydrofolate dehydrogenase (NADP+)/methenyltetrahydrofolate cyclohydrolase